MLLFTQARLTPLPLSKPLGVSLPITLIAPSTSGTAQARLNGPFTSWHMKTLLVPRLLLDAIQLLCLTLFDPRVPLPASTHGELSLLVLYLRVTTSSLSKMVSRTFSSPPILKVGTGFYLLVSQSPCVPGWLNHAPIGEFRQCFFPAECTQCLCGHCQVETRQHIFANCRRFAHFPLTDLVPTVKDFVKFLKEHPSAFAFLSQDYPSSEPHECLTWFLFSLCCR